MRTARTTRGLMLALVTSLALAGCQSARPVATAQPSSSVASQSAGATSKTPTSSASSGKSTPSSVASGSPSTPANTAAMAGSAKKDIAPLRAPIATLPAPKPAKKLTGPSTRGVPVLMYHEIALPPAGAAHPDLYVTPQEFVDQMTYLSTHGYHAVTLQQVWDYWHGTSTLPSKPVVISFDDGDTPDFTIVAPLLNELHWPGTLNLIVGRKNLRFRPSIVRALIAAGWEIDSHTMTHTDVPGLSAKELRYEISQSRVRLRELYGVPVNFFCYPSGRFDDNAVAAVEAAGYLGATTTHPGLARPENPFLMRRVRVIGGNSVTSFGALLRDAQ